jgi:hypothetical protein
MPKRTIHLTLIKRPLIVLFAFSTVLLHAGAQAAPDTTAIAPGTWGGEYIILEVSERGAVAEFDCAHGQVTQPRAKKFCKRLWSSGVGTACVSSLSSAFATFQNCPVILAISPASTGKSR